MPKGKPWTKEEEKKLREMVKAGKSIKVMSEAYGKTQNAIRQKMLKLNLKEEKKTHSNVFSSSELRLPEELPSVEEVLKVLAGALTAAKQGDLTRTEIQRLNVIVNLVRTYQELLADYIDYRGIEAKLVELEAKYEKLTREKS